MKVKQVGSNLPLSSSKTPLTQAAFKWWPHLILLTAFLVYANTINHRYAYDNKTNIYANTYVQKGIAHRRLNISA